MCQFSLNKWVIFKTNLIQYNEFGIFKQLKFLKKFHINEFKKETKYGLS
jgi:hypothetical protein